MNTLSDLIERNARLHGSRPCFAGTHALTHLQFAQRCWRLANAWLARGVKPGDRVGFLLRNSIESMEVYGAAEAAGFIAVPLNWRLAAQELAQVLQDCKPAALVTSTEFLATAQAACELAQCSPQMSVVDPQAGRVDAQTSGVDAQAGRVDAQASGYDDLLRQGQADRPQARPRPEDVAHIVYTSGTTGRPKGVMWTHQAVLAAAQELALATSARPTDRIVISMPLFHVGAKIEWLGVQVVGGSCVLLGQFSELDFFKAVQEYGANAAHLAPTMVKRLVEHPERRKFRLTNLRRVMYGSAPVRGEELRSAVAAFGQIFYQIYGMTEHMCISVLSPWDQKLDGDALDAQRLESAGQPFLRTQVRIVDEAGQDLPQGQEGEIVIRSPGITSGYFNAPAQTAEAFLEGGWLRTGDIGRLDGDGYLYVVDRRKDMIVSGGENVYSREVEDVLLSHPAVQEAAVIGVPDPRWGESIKAIVVLAPGQAELPEAELLALCKERLAGYKKPKSFDVIAALPRLAHGKVDKKALRAPYWAQQSRRV
jgi:acyl-CoA synthetase (AMP-forming)/AMP-acid ligase II